jgi:release factor glutamine methyltransferase
MTLEELYREGIAALRPAGASALEARMLLEGAAGISDLDFLREPRRPAGRRVEARFRRALRVRKEGMPLAYLTGMKEFWSLPIRVGPGVLIPRPETELLVELVLARAGRPDPAILDLGTGSGCIALALAAELPGALITAADASRRALRVARDNARRLTPEGMRRGGGRRLAFVRSDYFSAFTPGPSGRLFDVVVSNPPYVSEDEWEKLDPGIRGFEPRRALVPGRTGLEAIRRIVEECPAHLKPGGWIVLEFGSGQRDDVLSLFDGRWRDVECHADLRGLPRAVSGRLTDSHVMSVQGGKG